MASSNEDWIPSRPPRPDPYPTADGVSPAFRRLGGYSWRLIAIGIVVWAAVIVIQPLQTLAIAVFFALLIAAWLMPLTRLLSKVLPRWLAAILSLLVFVAGVAAIFFFIGLSAVSQWEGIGVAIRDGIVTVEQWLQTGPLAMTEADLQSLYDRVYQFFRDSGGTIALGVLSGLGSALGVVTAGAAAFFILIFVLIQPHRMFAWFTSWIPSRHREVVATSTRIGWTAFSQYSVGILLVAGTNAILVTVLLMVMKVPLAIPLGIIVFFGAFIPYIGAPIAMLLAALVAFATNGPIAGLLVILLIFLIGQLEGNVLHPLIMGQSVNLHPVAIVGITAVFAAYFGLVGALVGVPIAAMIYGIAKYLRGKDNPMPPATPDDAEVSQVPDNA
jgi:predicted PurR-regulated permease PerM